MKVRISGLSTLPRAARKPALIEAAVLRAFSLEKSPADGEVSVVFVSRAEHRALNLQYLGHDDDTDVISFEHEPLRGVPSEECPIGDIFISSWMAAQQAAAQKHSVLREVLILTAHGVLHLLGHDDHAPRAKARMFRRQDEIVESLRV